METLRLWYLATQLASEKEAGTIYFPLQNMLRSSDNLEASVYRLQVMGKWCVLILGEKYEQVTPVVQQKLLTYFTRGTLTELPRKILVTVAARRSERVQDAIALEGSSNIFTETHTPSVFPDIPEEVANTSLLDFVNIGKEHMSQPASTHDPLTLLLPSLRKKPFIIGYQLYSAEVYKQENKAIFQEVSHATTLIDDMRRHSAMNMVTHMNTINELRLKRSKKYLFTPSALSLHSSVMSHHSVTVQPVQRNTHLWVECHNEQVTPYGKLRAMFFSDAYPLDEIGIVASGNTTLYDYLTSLYSLHNGKWGLEIIDDDYNTLYDFTFDRASKQWVFLPSHKCPTGECKYPSANNFTDYLNYEALGIIQPCDHCIEACSYFARWLVTALAMVEGEYALSPEGETFSTVQQEYTSTELQRVGKGKNTRNIATSVKREVEYTLITYDVTRPHRPLTSEETTEVQEATRSNWLLTTSAGDVIWVKKKIKAYARRYPTRKDGSRQAGEVTIKNDFVKRVPMLRVPHTPHITRVVASQSHKRNP